MRRVVGVATLMLVAVVLQTTVGHHLVIFGVSPDLILVVTICIGLSTGPSPGAFAGFGGGLLRDFMLNAPTGLSALAYLSVGYAVGAIRPYVRSSSVAVPLVGVAAGSLVGESFYIGLSLLLGVPAEPGSRLVQVIVLTGLYNTLLAPLIYPIVRRLSADPYGEAVFPGRAGRA